MRPSRIVPVLGLLAAAAPAQWSQRTTPTSPPARYEAGMTYDLLGLRSVLFGGSPTGFPATLFNDTWTYDGSDWVLQAPLATPAPRNGMSLVFDQARAVVVMYGGMTSMISIARPNDETWEWDGTTWTQITTATTPGGLTAYGFVHDTGRGRSVLYGGSSNPGLLVDSDKTWEYDGVNWVRINTPTNPGLRQGPAMCYWPSLGRTILFGGISVHTGGNSATWSYDGTNWSQIAVVGPSPQPRTLAKMVFDTARQVCVMHGGMDAATGAPLDETWEFDGLRWTRIALPVPTSRLRFAMSFDPARRKVVLHGGVAGGQALNDTHEYGASWEPLGPGCAGSNGVPTLAGTSMPRFGAIYTVTLGNLANGATLAAIVSGLSATQSNLGPLPLDLTPYGMPGCSMFVSPDSVVFLPVIAGFATVSLPVPQDPGVLGLQLHQQGVSLDLGANPAGLVASNAITGTVGH